MIGHFGDNFTGQMTQPTVILNHADTLVNRVVRYSLYHHINVSDGIEV